MKIGKRSTKKKVANKKATKKKAAKKRAQKRKVPLNAPSRATKKKPTRRLKKRRAKNTVEGYYPNPASKRSYITTLVGNKVGYFTGYSFDTDKLKAILYGDEKSVAFALKSLRREKLNMLGVFPSDMSPSQILESFVKKK